MASMKLEKALAYGSNGRRSRVFNREHGNRGCRQRQGPRQRILRTIPVSSWNPQRKGHSSSTAHVAKVGTLAKERPQLCQLTLPSLLLLSHQMIRVISSPSRSTTGFFTAIFLALRAVAVLANPRVWALATRAAVVDGRTVRPAIRIMAPVALTLAMVFLSLKRVGNAEVGSKDVLERCALLDCFENARR